MFGDLEIYEKLEQTFRNPTPLSFMRASLVPTTPVHVRTELTKRTEICEHREEDIKVLKNQESKISSYHQLIRLR